MPYFRFSRVERVIARWTIEAQSLSDAMDKWQEQSAQGITLEGEEVTEVYEENWADADGKDLTAEADAIAEAEDEDDEDDGCPKCDPDCLGNNGDCHDACEWPEDLKAAL